MTETFEPEGTTFDEMVVAISITKRNIEKNVKMLKDAGTIHRVGSEKEGYWDIT